MINPCVDCISLAICCHMKTGDLVMKCDDIRAFLLESSKVETQYEAPPPETPEQYNFAIPRYLIRLNQGNVDIVHSYFRKVKALGI